MGSKKLLVTGAVIAAVAAAAILVPSVAAGVPLALPFAPATAVGPGDDGPGENGRGNAFGHDKDSDRFPGDRSDRGDKKDKADKHDDGPGRNGRGNAFGHDKDSPDFPGNGNGNR